MKTVVLAAFVAVMGTCVGCAEVDVDGGACGEYAFKSAEQSGPVYGPDSDTVDDEKGVVHVDSCQLYKQFIDAPDGAVITKITVNVDPGDRDEMNDTTPPTLMLAKYNISDAGDVTVISTASDQVDTVRDYVAPHQLSVCAHERHERSKYMYYITYAHECGGFAKPGIISKALAVDYID